MPYQLPRKSVFFLNKNLSKQHKILVYVPRIKSEMMMVIKKPIHYIYHQFSFDLSSQKLAFTFGVP